MPYGYLWGENPCKGPNRFHRPMLPDKWCRMDTFGVKTRSKALIGPIARMVPDGYLWGKNPCKGPNRSHFYEEPVHQLFSTAACKTLAHDSFTIMSQLLAQMPSTVSLKQFARMISTVWVQKLVTNCSLRLRAKGLPTLFSILCQLLV